MSRAKRFLEEALQLIGEEDELKKDDTVDFTDDGAQDDSTPPADDLDLGGIDDVPPVEDEFGLGASSAPSVKIEKDGPITINKGEVQLSIGDDGTIDISLDGGGADIAAPADEPVADLGAGNPEEEKPSSTEEDDYEIDWDKEKDKQPKESLEEGTPDSFSTQVTTASNRRQGVPAGETQDISKARRLLNMGNNSGDAVRECKDKMYECMSCECYDECDDKHKKKAEEEDDKDFLTQGYF